MLPIPSSPSSQPVKHVNHREPGTRLHCAGKLAETILLRPFTSTLVLAGRTVKLLTWDLAKAGVNKILGYHNESAAGLQGEYLKTVKGLRDFLFVPAVAARAFQDLIGKRETFVDDIPCRTDYLKVPCTKTLPQYSSYLHGLATFEVNHPDGISEFPATSDPTLQTVMASNIFQPGVMAINFGCPNVATFITEEKDGAVETTKVDAKSLYREEMTFHTTNGKIQSGVFLVPTNLPEEALARFKAAATEMEKRKDVTCVNTNCRVLEKAGFSIENVSMSGVIFPGTLMEHLLYRNVFYTDSQGVKHKVHFDIVNTTKDTLETYLEKVDTAVVGTRLRHRERHADTKEKQELRGEAAKAIIAEENARLAGAQHVADEAADALQKRVVTVSVPSVLGNIVANLWGRHTMYELDLADKATDISDAFSALALSADAPQALKLRPFPQEKPSFGTRLKKNIFFSGPMIRFLRRHMMGRSDKISLHTQDLFKHLKSSDGAHLNYVLLDDKMVLAMVHANGDSKEAHKKTADWALSKHALLAGRAEVYCSGEIWFDKEKNRFVMNGDSGTYTPTQQRVECVVGLANRIFNTDESGIAFEAAQPAETK